MQHAPELGSAGIASERAEQPRNHPKWPRRQALEREAAVGGAGAPQALSVLRGRQSPTGRARRAARARRAGASGMGSAQCRGRPPGAAPPSQALPVPELPGGGDGGASRGTAQETVRGVGHSHGPGAVRAVAAVAVADAPAGEPLAGGGSKLLRPVADTAALVPSGRGGALVAERARTGGQGPRAPGGPAVRLGAGGLRVALAPARAVGGASVPRRCARWVRESRLGRASSRPANPAYLRGSLPGNRGDG